MYNVYCIERFTDYCYSMDESIIWYHKKKKENKKKKFRIFIFGYEAK